MSSCSPVNPCPGGTSLALNPVDSGSTTFDGAGDATLSTAQDNTAAITEFDLTSLPAGAVVRSAGLELTVPTSVASQTASFSVRGWAGNGAVTDGDYHAGTEIATFSYPGAATRIVDVTQSVRQRLLAGDQYAGLSVRITSPGSVTFSSARLIFTLVMPKVCCNTTSGACAAVAADVCCPAGSTQLTSAMTCAPQPCPQPVACCDPCGACTVVLPGTSCAQGLTALASAVCGPQSCAVPTFDVRAAAPTGLGRISVNGRNAPTDATLAFTLNGFRGQSSGAFTTLQIGVTARFITAVATPETNWRFTGWAPNSPCTPQNTTIDANGVATCTYERPCTDPSGTLTFQPIFEIAQGTVKVVVNGPGSVFSTPAGVTDCRTSSGVCQASFPINSQAEFTAVPDTNAWFTGWAQTSAGFSGDPAIGFPITVNVTGPGPFQVVAGFVPNSPPVARCRDILIDARTSCPTSFRITPAQVDAGSSDPDTVFGDTIRLSIDNPGPFPVGTTNVRLTVTDQFGASSSCIARVTVLAQDCDDDLIPDVCECFYTNAAVPSSVRYEDAQLSHVGGGAPGGARVADDIYFPPGTVNRVSAFRGRMVTTAPAGFRKARLDFFEDCDGVPAARPFASYVNSVIESETPISGGQTLVAYRFDLCDPGVGLVPPPTADRPAEPLWLDGGKVYWVSLSGVQVSFTPGDTSASYWVTSNRGVPIIGRPPQTASGSLGGNAPFYDLVTWGPWANLADCCIGCVNMEFTLSGESCPCPWDQTFTDETAVTGARSGSLGTNTTLRAADNFVIPPCDPRMVCLIEGYIWTTCAVPQAFVEIYTDVCGVPTALQTRLSNVTATDMLARANRDGRTFKLYRVRANIPRITLAPGTYWLSIGATGSGSINEQTYFAARRPACNTPSCGITISPARVLDTTRAAPTWTATSPSIDLAFRVVLRDPASATMAVNAGGGSSSPQRCAVDIDRSGAADVPDIFAFLSAWFAGCP